VIDLAVKNDVLEKGGAGWYTIDGQKIQGADKVTAYLDEHDMWDGIKEKLLDHGMVFDENFGGTLAGPAGIVDAPQNG
jgi:hypothetical protein